MHAATQLASATNMVKYDKCWSVPTCPCMAYTHHAIIAGLPKCAGCAHALPHAQTLTGVHIPQPNSYPLCLACMHANRRMPDQRIQHPLCVVSNQERNDSNEDNVHDGDPELQRWIHCLRWGFVGCG